MSSRGHGSFDGEADGALTFNRPSRSKDEGVIDARPKDGEYRVILLFGTRPYAPRCAEGPNGAGPHGLHRRRRRPRPGDSHVVRSAGGLRQGWRRPLEVRRGNSVRDVLNDATRNGDLGDVEREGSTTAYRYSIVDEGGAE